MFDISHLLKTIRNNLLHHNYIFADKIASWKYIEEFYNCDKKTQFRAAPKLTDTYRFKQFSANESYMRHRYSADLFQRI